MQTLINLLLTKRHLFALVTVLLGGAVTWGSVNTRLDSTFSALLSEDDPLRAEVEEVRKDFPPSTAVLFAFLSTEGDVFNFEMLRAIDDLTNRYVEVESAVSVGSLLNRRLSAVDADLFDRDYLIPELSTLTLDDLNDIRKIALEDEALTKSMLSPEGDMALALIKYRATADDQETRLSIGRSVIALRDSLRAEYPELTIYVLGGVLFELEGYNAQIQDSRYLFPLVITINILVLWFCLRSLSFSLCLFGVALATIGLTVGTVGWAKVPFNQISTMAPLVVVMIAMADGIHIVSIYVQGLHRSLGKIEAMRQSLAANIQPVSLTTVTTAMGFLSLNYCSSPGIYGFGNVVAIGVCWAYVVTLTLLPTLILLLPIRDIPQPLGLRGFISGV
nr:MMPL family transporter [Pseudomonadota bacterium]